MNDIRITLKDVWVCFLYILIIISVMAVGFVLGLIEHRWDCNVKCTEACNNFIYENYMPHDEINDLFPRAMFNYSSGGDFVHEQMR